MDYYKFYLGDFTNHGKHKSSYFNLPAAVVVLIAFFLPGLLGMLDSNVAYFSSLILVAVAAFEKKSDMVRFYCFQFCLLAMFSNLTLTALSLIAMVIPAISYINACLSLVFGAIILFAFFYSIFNAFKYRSWNIPWISDLVTKLVMKI